MMKQEVKEKWLEALRSGEYKQGRHQLKNDDNTYCCLGVLCDVYRKETKNGIWSRNMFMTEDEGSMAILTNIVVRWAGLTDQNPTILSKGRAVATLNDSDHTFAEIADMIEKEW